MDWDIQFVFFVIAVASVLFASGRVRFDIVASMVLVSLTLGGILTPEEAFAGFGNPVVVLVACLLILGEILTRTGVAYAVGEWLSRAGGDSEVRLLVVLMLCAALLGSVMSSTAVVAILVPVMVQVANKSGIHVSRLLLPLSYAALISGMLTLIATVPNLVVSAELQARGYDSFHFFSITPIGLTVLAVAVIYMLLLGRRLLPKKEMPSAPRKRRSNQELITSYSNMVKAQLYLIPVGSVMVGSRIRDSLLSRFRARILLIQRSEVFGDNIIALPRGDRVLKGGDYIVVEMSPELGADLAEVAGLQRREITDERFQLWAREAGGAVVMIHPESALIGRPVSKARIRENYNVEVVAIRRRGEELADAWACTLEAGDQLLVIGGWKYIAELQTLSHDFVLIAKPAELEHYVPKRRKAPVGLAIVLIMVLLSAFDVVPIVMAVLIAVGLGVLTRCITMDDAYMAIPWSSIVLIAGMLPVADALQKTGGVDLIVETLVRAFSADGPLTMMTALFFLTASLGLFLSNTATAVLLAPVAIRAAEIIGVEPYAFAVAIAVAASSAFITPFSTPVVTLVVEPGGYRFLDFLKLGVPLLILTWLVTILLVPVLFPF